MKWRQKYHVTSAIYNISSFASISQWACRSTPQPGQNRPDACSIGPTSARHGRSTGPLVHLYVWITQLFQYIIIKSWKSIPMKMRQWQPIWQGSPQIHQATHLSLRRVFTSENRKCDPASAASYRAIRAATMATSNDTKTSSRVYPKKYAHGFVVLCFVVVM